jgi:hypothetical protein
MAPPPVGTLGTGEILPPRLPPPKDKSSRSWIEQGELGTRVGSRSSSF